MKHTRVVSTKCTPGFASRAFNDTTLVCFIVNEHTTKCSHYTNMHTTLTSIIPSRVSWICPERRLSSLTLSSVYSPTVEDGSWSTPMVPAQLPVPLQQVQCRRVGTETCGMDNVCPPDDLQFGLDTYGLGTGCLLPDVDNLCLLCID